MGVGFLALFIGAAEEGVSSSGETLPPFQGPERDRCRGFLFLSGARPRRPLEDYRRRTQQGNGAVTHVGSDGLGGGGGEEDGEEGRRSRSLYLGRPRGRTARSVRAVGAQPARLLGGGRAAGGAPGVGQADVEKGDRVRRLLPEDERRVADGPPVLVARGVQLGVGERGRRTPRRRAGAAAATEGPEVGVAAGAADVGGGPATPARPWRAPRPALDIRRGGPRRTRRPSQGGARRGRGPGRGEAGRGVRASDPTTSTGDRFSDTYPFQLEGRRPFSYSRRGLDVSRVPRLVRTKRKHGRGSRLSTIPFFERGGP